MIKKGLNKPMIKKGLNKPIIKKAGLNKQLIKERKD